MIAVTVAGVLGIAALAEIAPSNGDRAAAAFDQARNSGASDTELCRSATVVANTYRAEGQASKVTQWSLYADIFCGGAR
jgi:hypothetical protein